MNRDHGEDGGHPNQKPINLIAKLIACATDAGDLVLDPLLGSGTTAVVAQSLGPHWLGIENNPIFVELARQRIESARELLPAETAVQSLRRSSRRAASA